MNFKTKFVENNTFIEYVNNINDLLIKNYKKSEIIYNSDKYFVNKNTIHFIFNLLNPKTQEEKIYYNLILNNIKKIETLSGNSVELIFLFNVFILKSLISNKETFQNKNSVETMQLIDNFLIKTKNLIEKYCEIIDLDILNQQIKFQLQDNILSDVVINAIKLSGFNGKIYVEDGKQENYLIERKNGFIFNAQTFKFFLTESNTSLERRNCKLLIIDGILETVSEIDQLLLKSIEFGQPICIIARGFSEEVIATLKVNFDKNILCAIPIKVSSDLNSLNILNDISSVCDSKVISSISGEFLSLVKWDDLKEVKKIKCNSLNFTIEDDSNLPVVNQQIKYLINKRLDNLHTEDIVDILDKRIKSLTNNITTITLPKLSDIENNTIRSKIDVALRLCKTLLNYGHIDFKNFVNQINPDNYFEETIKKSLLESSDLMSINVIPSLSLFLSISSAIKNSNNVLNSSGIVVMD